MLNRRLVYNLSALYEARILLSVSVVRSAYRSHLKRFSSDIGTLRACGASRRQISALFAAELAAAFLLAAACAVVISILSLKALFTAFLEIRHDSLSEPRNRAKNFTNETERGA